MPRAIWSGAISFGLVNIPVKLYQATASASGREISEVAKGKYVEVTSEERGRD